MIKKFNLFLENSQFLDLNDIYDYKYMGVKTKNDSKGFYSYSYTYEFLCEKIPFLLVIFYYFDNTMSFEWGDKEQIKRRNRKDSDPLTKNINKNLNINSIYKILNTIFKILFDFIEINKKIIESFEVGSFNKSKYKMYKNIIKDNNNYELIKDESYDRDGRMFYHLSYKIKK